MNPYTRLMRSLSGTAGMRWTLSKVLTPLDLRLRGTRLAPSTLGLHAPLCYLTTIGRITGEARTVPLLHVDAGGDAIAVVATNFGKRHHPGWAHNLLVTPSAKVEIDGRTREVVARRATDGEVPDIWTRFDAVWPGYNNYREIAPRNIMVFVLTPTTTPSEDGQPGP